MRLGLSLVLSAACACSGRGQEARPAPAHDGGPVEAPVRVAVPEPLPLGTASAEGFDYRRGPGREAYSAAVRAEKLARDDADWQAVIDASRAALAADPGHLDAAWLLAAALARKGEHDAILEPLSRAVAGDWGKWGERSLTLPLFADFLASPHGEAWRTLAEDYRAAFAQAARRALVVVARHGDPRAGELARRTELLGWDPDTGRWLRLSRTNGTVVATLRGEGVVAYVAYRDLARGDRGAVERPRVAVVDLATGRVSRELAFAGAGELRLAWGDGDDPALLVAARGGKDAGTWIVDWKRGQKQAAPAKTRLAGEVVTVARGQVQRRRVPVPGVTADWDDDGLASAIRLDATRKTVTPPAGLVDGHAFAWSPERARAALVAVPEDDCEAPATVMIVDAGTGKLREVGRAVSPAPVWVDELRLAYTAGDRVAIVDVAGKPVTELTAAAGLATAIVDRACAPPDEEALFAVPPGDDVEPVEEPAP